VVASSIHETKVPGSNPGADTLTFRFRLNAERVNYLRVSFEAPVIATKALSGVGVRVLCEQATNSKAISSD